MKQTQYATLGETVYSGKLENGLHVYAIPKPGFQKKYAFFATSYGGADRRFRLDGTWHDTPAGIAHFLEHKLFDTETGNALADLAANGAQPNAFTSGDMTAYYFECTDAFWDNLKTLLEFVSTPYFTDESVQKEQGIIGQEIAMIEDSPSHVGYYNLLKSLYRHNPVRDSIAGTVQSIAEITAQTLYDCHRAFYRPSNMVLCVVGDVDPEQALATAEEILPQDCMEIPQKDYGAPDDALVVQSRCEEAMEISRPRFYLGTRAVHGTHGRAYLEQELTGHLAASYLIGKSSPLYMRLYREGLLTHDFACGLAIEQSHSITEFTGESRDPDAVLSALQNEIAQTLQRGVDAMRFMRLQKATQGKLIRGLDSTEDLCYNQTQAHFHGAKSLERSAVLAEMNEDMVLDFIRENLNPEQFALSIVKPR